MWLGEETIDHLFTGCEVVRCCRFGSLLGLWVEDGVGFHDFLQRFLTKAKEDNITEV